MLDIIIFISLFFGLWQGFQVGLLRSLVSLFGWLFALIFATYFAKPLSGFFIGLSNSPILTVLIAFIVVALCVIVGLQMILWVMSKTLSGLKLSILDKLAGAVFGISKNLMVILLVFSLIAPFIQNSQFWQQSKVAPALLPFAPFAVELSKNITKQVSDVTTEQLDDLSNQ